MWALVMTSGRRDLEHFLHVVIDDWIVTLAKSTFVLVDQLDGTLQFRDEIAERVVRVIVYGTIARQRNEESAYFTLIFGLGSR
jgi:hypothetical protein